MNHGIGKYIGIGTLEVGGIHKDYLHILYAGGDKLSVPIEQIDLMQKYVGSEEKEPKMNKLGGSGMERRPRARRAHPSGHRRRSDQAVRRAAGDDRVRLRQGYAVSAGIRSDVPL